MPPFVSSIKTINVNRCTSGGSLASRSRHSHQRRSITHRRKSICSASTPHQSAGRRNQFIKTGCRHGALLREGPVTRCSTGRHTQSGRRPGEVHGGGTRLVMSLTSWKRRTEVGHTHQHPRWYLPARSHTHTHTHTPETQLL